MRRHVAEGRLRGATGVLDKEEGGNGSDDTAVSQRQQQQQQQAAPMHGAGASLEPQETTARKRLSHQLYPHRPEFCLYHGENKYPDGADIPSHALTHQENGAGTGGVISPVDGRTEEANLHRSSDMSSSTAAHVDRSISGDGIATDGACLDAHGAGLPNDGMVAGPAHDNLERRTPRAPCPSSGATKRGGGSRCRPSVAQHRTSRTEGPGGSSAKEVGVPDAARDVIVAGGDGNGAKDVGLEVGGRGVAREQSNLEDEIQPRRTRTAEGSLDPKIVADTPITTDLQSSRKHSCHPGSPSHATALGPAAVGALGTTEHQAIRETRPADTTVSDSANRRRRNCPGRRRRGSSDTRTMSGKRDILSSPTVNNRSDYSHGEGAGTHKAAKEEHHGDGSIEYCCVAANVVGSPTTIPPLEAAAAPREHSPPPPPGLRRPTASSVDRSKGEKYGKASCSAGGRKEGKEPQDEIGCAGYREALLRGSSHENNRGCAAGRASGQEVIHLAFCSRCQSYQSWRCPIEGRRGALTKGGANRVSVGRGKRGSRQRACGKCGDVFCNVSYYPTK